ncbi:uncharacterized protein LOC118205351 [Stegodyphus dumicola]|uniref:uncharacterized protein LOC118205351 n=1 Tax=Stegodyphus dumicola TaxID=202533 RepID=UPI0015AC4982|nr:uncharacterized protein LOC118205351 [Stegodyphus dumicola]
MYNHIQNNLACNSRHINYAKFMFFNCNGIKSQVTEIKDYINRHSLDIVLFNETHLRTTDSLKIANFDVFRSDRIHNRGGGTAIAAKRYLKCCKFALPIFNSIEACACILNSKGVEYLIVSIYKPPGNSLNTQDLDYIARLGYPTIIAGDMNCKNTNWNCRTNNQDGIVLYNYIINNNVQIFAPTEHTYCPMTRSNSDILDIMLTFNVSQQPYLSVDNDLSSDHLPVRFTLYGLRHGLPPMKTRTNWIQYQNEINNNITPNANLNSKEEIDTAIQNLNIKIQSALKNAQFVKNEDITLPYNIRLKIKEKNRLRKIVQRTQNPQDRRNFNKCNKELRLMMIKYRSEAWENFVDSLSHTDSTVWRISKALRKEENNIGPIKHNNQAFHKAEDIANIFTSDYEDQFTLNQYPNPNDVNIENHVKDYIAANSRSVGNLITPDK